MSIKYEEIPIYNEEYVNKANKLEPYIYEKCVRPNAIVNVAKDENNNWVATHASSVDSVYENILENNKPICFDFADHYVGYLTLKIGIHRMHQDAPIKLKIKFAEICDEIGEKTENYKGNLSNAWIQEEIIHIDDAPCYVKLPRRYAFRYVSIELISYSASYDVNISEVYCTAITSADETKYKPLDNLSDDMLKNIERVSAKTLMDCMQSVFEDGPKRDRRLWIGDLRLQALANYETFNNVDLVKRCIYLFAGLSNEQGGVNACLYTTPKYMAGGFVLLDYSLFFISCLYDYYHYTKDKALVEELWCVAYKQIELAMNKLSQDSLAIDTKDWYCFLDWGNGLNKQAGAQGVLIYTLKQARELCKEFNFKEYDFIDDLITKTSKAAIDKLWDDENKVFISGEERQISMVSQIWLLLADILERDVAVDLLRKMLAKNDFLPLATPYMEHHFVQALIDYDLLDEALVLIKEYWGKMLELGADTFWEIFNPDDVNYSAYGDKIINSFCHAWSCTPTYFIRKYFNK